MVTLSGHAYPWDVLGDPGFADRVLDLGLTSVTLAASYHSTRAATPMHPTRALVDAWHAALYRPLGPWDGPLRPSSPEWMDEADPFGEAAEVLRAAGISVTAWVVLAHDSGLGRANPGAAVVNCFGERYPYALCPSAPEVREYLVRLAVAAVRDAPVCAVSLESCGQMGVAHLGCHEKTTGAWTALAERLLSVCCCAHCAAGWREHGLDPAEAVAALREAVRDDHEPALLDVVLAVRAASTAALRRDVVAAVRLAAPGAPITLHANPDPWATGPSPGLAEAPDDVDALLVPAWPVTDGSVAAVAAAAATGLPTHAYVTVLPPADPSAVVHHARRLLAAGASGLGLYHLGLAPAWLQSALADVVDATGGTP